MGFFEKILSLDLADYGAVSFPIGIVLLCIFIGMIAATVVVQYTNRMIYRTVKALSRHKADSEKTAKSLSALGLFAEKGILRAVKKENAMLMRYLCHIKAENPGTSPEAPNTGAGEDLYYLNPAMADRASEILSGTEPSVMHTVLYALLFVAIYLGLASILPLALSVIL